MVAFSQPDPVIAQQQNVAREESNAFENAMGCFFSFSQPIEGSTEDFFLTSSSSSTVLSSQNNQLANQWVKRMTRFFVKTDKSQTFTRIVDVLERNNLQWKGNQCGLAKYFVVSYIRFKVL